jgi:hypothetical protein
MKTKRVTLAIGLGLLLSLVGFSQTPPPNDNYSNSITLTGTDVTFTGTLAGATIEDSQEVVAYTNFFGPSPTESIWWNWTAPTNTVLTLDVLFPNVGYNHDILAIYTATNGILSPSGLQLPALGVAYIPWSQCARTLSVLVTAGTTYHIQLCGITGTNYTIRLVATNTPIIMQQPRSQAVVAGESALFYVLYSGYAMTNFTFQWSFNGTNLSDETAPMLALTNINSSMAGSYAVAISNAAGVTISDQATLTVGQGEAPGYLKALDVNSNLFMVSVTGETGWRYRLQSSSDLTNWTSENYFVRNYIDTLEAPNVFFGSNISQTVMVPGAPATMFFRTAPYVVTEPDSAVCINNLRQISVAQQLWLRSDPLIPVGLGPYEKDLLPYFPHQILPVCPDDPDQSFESSYSLGRIYLESSRPTCDIHPATHVLEEPQ